ncbi:MAG: hypothetical protein JWM95_4888 [Gemmatimonadetes bacterium]|nr:hypothetical protein [Gemmatimonadota bacterium]
MIAHSRSLRNLAVTLGAVLLLAAPVRAQDASIARSNDTSAVAAPASAAGPTMDAAAAGVRNTSASSAAPAPMAGTHSQSQPVAMMVVGGAAIIAGAVVGGGGGYAISVVGAVIGLMGLYQYLQ